MAANPNYCPPCPSPPQPSLGVPTNCCTPSDLLGGLGRRQPRKISWRQVTAGTGATAISTQAHSPPRTSVRLPAAVRLLTLLMVTAAGPLLRLEEVHNRRHPEGPLRQPWIVPFSRTSCRWVPGRGAARRCRVPAGSTPTTATFSSSPGRRGPGPSTHVPS